MYSVLLMINTITSNFLIGLDSTWYICGNLLLPVCFYAQQSQSERGLFYIKPHTTSIE